MYTRRIYQRCGFPRAHSYEQRLERLGMTFLSEELTVLDLTMAYKILYSLYPCAEELLTERDLGARPSRAPNSRQLTIDPFQRRCRERYFSTRVAAQWNSLPDHLVQPQKPKTFKESVRAHLASQQL